MNWFGNSFDKAYGLSNMATNALKKAQKKLDKVLDIPTEDELNIRTSTNSNTNKEAIIKEENPSNDLLEEDKEFIDINLQSPGTKFSNKNELVFDNYDAQILDSDRLGDWNTEESLTASQFERCCEAVIQNKDLSEDNIKSNMLESSNASFQSSLINDDNEDDIDESASLNQLDQSNTLFIDESSSTQKENMHFIECNRFSHLSISSDCTTSTVKRVYSDMDSSDHTDDFTSINNDMAKSDSSAINDEPETEISAKADSSSVTKCESKIAIENINKIPFNHSVSLNLACKDDIDSNTTSSDIEPLSCTNSTNGDNYLVTSHSQSRYFVPDFMKHQRSASGSSMSICKIDNFEDSMDPDQNSYNNILQKQIEELSKKLDIRESKMIQLSRENIDLRDTINNLTRQIEQMNERQETDTTDINALTREFTNRLSDAEKRYQLANKERDQLKKCVSELKNTESQQIEKVIKEKEDQVASLLQEGEKLAQDQLKANNTVKKLRGTVKEQMNEISIQNQKIAKFESEISHLQKVLDSHEENERKHIDGINQLTKAVEKLERENSQINNTKETLQDRNRTLEAALDKSSHELVKLRKQIIELESEKNSIEKNNKSLINQQANKSDAIVEIKLRLEQSENEVCLLQKKVQNQAREFNYKEDEYNSRISYLQERIAEMEQRQEELSEGISHATKPILRQLESLQNSCSMHTSSWEQNEMNLNLKLIDFQQKLAISEEEVQTYKEQLQSRDFIANSLREEKNRLLVQYNQEYMSKQSVIDEKMILEQKIIELEQKFSKKSDHYLNEIQNLEYKLSNIQQNLDMEKQNSNNLSAKLTNMQLMIDNKPENKVYRSRTNSGTSVADIEPDDNISIISNKSLDNADKKVNGAFSVYEQIRQQGVAVMIEYLEASLKQKEGQISKLHRELQNMSRSRDSMIEEMTKLTQTIEKLENKLEEQQSAINNVSELNDRYNALLQMYGEKLEECQELRMDISEMKEVYRSHIDMLSKSNEAL